MSKLPGSAIPSPTNDFLWSSKSTDELAHVIHEYFDLRELERKENQEIAQRDLERRESEIHDSRSRLSERREQELKRQLDKTRLELDERVEELRMADPMRKRHASVPPVMETGFLGVCLPRKLFLETKLLVFPNHQRKSLDIHLE